MISQNNGKKQRVWQDIVPVKNRPPITGITPSKKRYHLRFHKISKKTVIILGMILITLIICAGCYFIFTKNPNASANGQINYTDEATDQTSDTITDIGKANPQFSTLLPSGKTISSLGGWTLISPKDSDPVYTYTDKINGIGVNISEQELPENLKEDTNQKIENLALSFNASQKISISNQTVYIGTSTNGPQSVIFTKNNLLILIKSDTTVSNDQWTAYISSLQ
jgi:hypothetical protein